VQTKLDPHVSPFSLISGEFDISVAAIEH